MDSQRILMDRAASFPKALHLSLLSFPSLGGHMEGIPVQLGQCSGRRGGEQWAQFFTHLGFVASWIAPDKTTLLESGVESRQEDSFGGEGTPSAWR